MLTMGAFLAGVATGWVGRGLYDAPRHELVTSVEKGMHAFARVRRWVSERVEWAEDVVAEGKARFEASRERAPQSAITAGDLAEEEAS
jgi:hypothetical protein